MSTKYPLLFLFLVSLGATHTCKAKAQLIPDNTLDGENSIVTPQQLRDLLIEGGAIRGENLFHSFSEFNVNEGQQVDFANPAGIFNILTRVTGANPSDIFGTLGVNGAANLILLNPNGINFGANAVLNVSGSFFATTAESFVLGEGLEFSASNPQAPPLITVNITPGLQLGANAQAPITNEGNLEVGAGQSLTLSGNEIISTGNLSAPGGTVQLLGGVINLLNNAQINVSAPTGGGDVILNAQGNITLKDGSGISSTGSSGGDITITSGGDISMSEGLINTSSNASSLTSPADTTGGNINITARSVSLSNGAQLVASTFGQGDAGGITINATDSVSFTASDVLSRVRPGAIGNAGNVEINAGSLQLRNDARISVNTAGQGNAGNVEVNTGSLDVRNGSRLIASTRGQGNAGNVIINATDSIFFDRERSSLPTGALSQVRLGGEGDAGNVEITTGSLEARNGAQINASTQKGGRGNAGSVIINATDTILLIGENNKVTGGALSRVEEGAIGNAGNVEVTTGSLEVRNGAQLDASTQGQGNAGSVIINATDRVYFDRENSPRLTGAFSRVRLGAIGNAGNVEITTGSLEVRNDAQLDAGTRGKGDAGSVIINAIDRVYLDGENSPKTITGAFSRVNSEGEGNAGDVRITTRSLEARNGAQISTATLGKGNAGSVIITATDNVSFDGENKQGVSGALSRVEEGAIGNAGGVEITTSSLEVSNGARLDANTAGKGNAGSITINATDSVSFTGAGDRVSGAFSQVEERAVGNAGGVEINTNFLEVSNGARIGANTRGEGNAGSVEINTNFLEVSNGAQIAANTFGQGDAGSVIITATDKVSFTGENSGQLTGVLSRVERGAIGNAGNVEINTGSLEVSNGARLTTTTLGKGNAGSININATDEVSFEGENSERFSGAFSEVNSQGEGDAGNVEINTGSLEVSNGARISTNTVGNGDAGSITINATDRVSFTGTRANGSGASGAFSQVEKEAVGNAGGVGITASSLELSNRGRIAANTSGQGNAGNIEVNTGSLEVRNGSRLVANTLGQGDAGSITINATDSISFDGEKSSRLTGILSRVGDDNNSEAMGDAGNVEINTGSLTLSNSARISVSTFGQGDAGSITINATDSISFTGESMERNRASGAFSQVNRGAVGNAGGVEINTGSLALSNGARLGANTFGQGDAGSIIINATDSVSFSGENSRGTRVTSALSRVEKDAIGNAGGVEITTSSLEVSNGARISTSTAGNGNAGSITINATDKVSFEGENSQGVSGAFSQVNSQGEGNAGNVEITTSSLEVSNGARLATNTLGKGNAGQVNLSGDEIQVTDSQITSTSSSNRGDENNNAGSVNLTATQSISLDNSTVSTTVEENARGNAGSVTLEAATISATNNSQISSSAQGLGQAGNVEITADNLSLDNSKITAETAFSGEEGSANINLQIADLLLLENESLISATAEGQANGGNVTIDAGFIIAKPPTGELGSDIFANAEQGNGGLVTINTNGLFGIQFRAAPTPLNDITASSQFGLAGEVTITQPNTDPAQSITALPIDLIDAPNLVARICPTGGREAVAKLDSFIVTGRGGLPQNPGDPLGDTEVSADLVSLAAVEATGVQESEQISQNQDSKQIVEAQGWLIADNGNLILTAEPNSQRTLDMAAHCSSTD